MIVGKQNAWKKKLHHHAFACSGTARTEEGDEDVEKRDRFSWRELLELSWA